MRKILTCFLSFALLLTLASAALADMARDGPNSAPQAMTAVISIGAELPILLGTTIRE